MKPKRKPPHEQIHKCKHCGWTYIESCDCRSKPKPAHPSDTERLEALLRWLAWLPSVGETRFRTRRDIDKLLKEEARRGKE